jgi:hypothetical protein
MAVLAATGLESQAIATRLVSGDPGLAVPGALVLLTDTLGHELGRVLTDESGRIGFGTLAPGVYRLRVLRIGYQRWESHPFALAAGDTLTRAIVVPQQPIVLAGLEVKAERQCRVHPAEGSLAATLWDEARKAMEATAYTESHRLYRFQTTLYTRSYDRSGTQVLAEERRPGTGWNAWPWSALPPESVAVHGFIQFDSAGAATYHGPDLGVLFSDEFLDRHCLGVREPAPSARDPLIGVAFEPVRSRGRHPVDIAGVLWLRRQSTELVSLEFTYADHGGWLVYGAGGSLAFDRLPSGAWVIRQWSIRAPRLRVVARTDTVGVAGYREEGAQVLQVLTAAGRPVVSYPLTSSPSTASDRTPPR